MPSFYIAPNSIVALLHDVPIDQNQEHTLWFADVTTQTNYFYDKAARILNQQYYVRQNRGVIKAEVTADQVYDCNYMMYKNTSFGNKWFYAFITSIEYTNNNTATITFQIDQLQTWFFEMVNGLGECFVEREHALTDVPGDNIVAENLETGEYNISRDLTVGPLIPMSVVIAATVELDIAGTDFEDVSGLAITGMYSGVKYYSRPFNAVDAASIADINNFLLLATKKGKADSIVSVFMCPTVLAVAAQAHEYESWKLPNGFTYYGRPTEIDGYTPHNNKLFTAPYCSILVKTPTNAAEFPWEYFTFPNAPTFEISGNCSTSPALMLMPMYYKTPDAIGQAVNKNYTESVTLSGFPQCSYTIDTYKAWLAQNSASLIVNGALATAGLALGAGQAFIPVDNLDMFGNYVNSELWFDPKKSGTLIGSLGAIGNILAQIYQHSILPPHALGSTDGNICLANRMMNFFFFTKIIRKDYAKIIDEFFDKFGYATHRVKVPNIHSRAIWTYTKTVDCIIHGAIPTEAITEIQNIFNRGVTFWANPAVVGQYSLAAYNTPLGV